jgi:hypothetical protein
MAELHTNVSQAQSELLNDLQSENPKLHKILLSKFGGMEPHQIVARHLEDQGKIDRYETIANFLESVGKSWIGEYSTYLYSDSGLSKINSLNDSIYESKVESEKIYLELIKKQVQKLLAGEIVSEHILQIYNKAKIYEEWEYLCEIIQEWHPDMISGIVGSRDLYYEPFNATELADAMRLLKTAGIFDSSIAILEKWFKGEIDISTEPEKPDFHLLDIMPQEEKIITESKMPKFDDW